MVAVQDDAVRRELQHAQQHRTDRAWLLPGLLRVEHVALRHVIRKLVAKHLEHRRSILDAYL